MGPSAAWFYEGHLRLHRNNNNPITVYRGIEKLSNKTYRGSSGVFTRKRTSTRSVVFAQRNRVLTN